jgi:hypothetical protein
VESIPLCYNASVKGGEHFIKNKIFTDSMDETWEDILKDLLEESNFIFGTVFCLGIKIVECFIFNTDATLCGVKDTIPIICFSFSFRLPDLIDRALISKFNCLSDRENVFFFIKIEFDILLFFMLH